jgi:protein gp37
MSQNTTIEWTDTTWQPITGCTIVSPGCTNCYAMKLAGTRLRHHPSRAGLTHETKAGPVWTGEVRLNEEWLLQPLRWKKPQKIFVCAHGDLFHENVPDEWIDKVFAVMAMASQHTFQVLTKRPVRMRDYINAVVFNEPCRINQHIDDLGGDINSWSPPMRNLWLGLSCERQKEADERIPLLLETPAAVRFISAEPLLSAIDLRQSMHAWRLSTGDKFLRCIG